MALRLDIALGLHMARRAKRKQVAKRIGDAVIAEQSERFDMMHVELLTVFSFADAAIATGVTIPGSRAVSLTMPVRPAFVADSAAPEVAAFAAARDGLAHLGTKDLVAGTKLLVLPLDGRAALGAWSSSDNPARQSAACLRAESRRAVVVLPKFRVAPLALAGRKTTRKSLAFHAAELPALSVTGPHAKRGPAMGTRLGRALAGIATGHGAVERAQSSWTTEDNAAAHTLNVVPTRHCFNIYTRKLLCNAISATTRRAEVDPDTYAVAKKRIGRGYTPSLFSGEAA